jgi:hypothetical protein
MLFLGKNKDFHILEFADRKRRVFLSSCHSERLNAPKRYPERRNYLIGKSLG